MTARLLASLAITALSMPAFAQTTADNSQPLSEIVVTGLKRDQKLSDVPVTAEVFTAQKIEEAGIERPQDFLNLTSNVTFIQDNHAGEAFVNIRGQASIRQAESAVAVVIDGVQLATQNEFNGELFDLQQIEVLKGPQSAIYGRNATAGALILSTKPLGDNFEGSITAGYGNWNTAKANGGVGGAIIPGVLRFRASFAISDSDGPFTDIVTGEKVYRSTEKDGRLRFIWNVNDDITADFRIGGSRVEGGGIAAHAQVLGATIGGYKVDKFDTNLLWQIPYVSDVPGLNVQNKFNVALKLDWKLPFANLTSVTSYSYIDDNYGAKNFPYADYRYPGNAFGVFEAAFGDKTQHYDIPNDAVTEEIRLTSTDKGPLRWIAGFYFLSEERDFTSIQGINTGGAIDPQLTIDGPNSTNPTSQFDKTHYEALDYAPFANAQYDVFDNLEVGVAARYDSERRRAETLTPNVPNLVTGAATYNLCVLNTGLAPDQCHGEKTFRQFQPKFTLTYKMPDLGTVFFSYGRGFKSGGFNPIGTRATLLNAYAAAGADTSRIFVQDSYGKEASQAYEIGTKLHFFGNRLTFDGAIFLTEVTGAQQFEFNPIAGIQAVSSIDATEDKGFEVDANYRIMPGVNLYASYGYVDAIITALKAAPQDVGNRVPYVSHYTANVGLQADQAITDTLAANFRIDYNLSGPLWFDAANSPNSERRAVPTVDARLGISTERWSLSVWGRNIFDDRYTEEVVPLVPNLLQAGFPGLPRSFGIEGRVNF